MVTTWLIVGFGILIAIILASLNLYLLRQVSERHQARKQQIEDEYQRRKRGLEQIEDKARQLPDRLVKKSLQMSFSDRLSGDLFYGLNQDQTALSRSWQKVGDTLQRVIDAAPPPEECEGMTSDEFEKAIRQNLEKKRKQQ